MQSRTLKILLSVAIVFLGGGMLVLSAKGDKEFFKYVHEVVPDPDPWMDKTVRLHGYVEAGSIHEEIVDQRTERTFVLESLCPQDASHCDPGSVYRMLVKSHGPVPDTFKELSEVVAKGRLVAVPDADHVVLEADEIMAKCPSKYEGSDRPSQIGQPPAGQGETGETPPMGGSYSSGGSY
jgi:cytochrome c-type biogenesis protein CcmE